MEEKNGVQNAESAETVTKEVKAEESKTEHPHETLYEEAEIAGFSG